MLVDTGFHKLVPVVTGIVAFVLVLELVDTGLHLVELVRTGYTCSTC